MKQHFWLFVMCAGLLFVLCAGLLFDLPAHAVIKSPPAGSGGGSGAITLTSPDSSVTVTGSGTSTLSVAVNASDITVGTLPCSIGPTYTGAFTVSGCTATLAAASVTLADMANLTANTIICNNTGSAATPVACTVSQINTLLGTLTASSTPTLSNTWTFSAAPTVNLTGQTSNTAVNGLLLENTTAATASNQQYVCQQLTGYGWKTTATAASEEADWQICNEPVQGTSAPTTNLVVQNQIAGGGYTAQLSLIGAAPQLLVPVGTSALPGLSFQGNAGYGFYISSATLYLSISGASHYTFGSAQLIGPAFNPNSSTVPGSGIYAPSTNVLGFSSNTTFAGSIDATQHWRLGGTAAATIGSGNCGTGTNGTISGNDHAGLITIGAATTATCAVSFATTYTTAPRAVLLQAANAAAATALSGEYVSAVSATGFTITGTLASTSWYYWVQ